MSEFTEFPKIARLSRECIITEKIDGTNAQVHILSGEEAAQVDPSLIIARLHVSDSPWVMLAGSRSRYITPDADNFGFAKWVSANAVHLWGLGLGRHFGEWWGSGVQRGYGLTNGEKRWSLFNAIRWCGQDATPIRIPTADPRIEKYQEVAPACCHVIPVLYRGLFSTEAASVILDGLKITGSVAAPGFMKPEGIIMFHIAGNVGFKKTIEKDDEPKSKPTQRVTTLEAK